MNKKDKRYFLAGMGIGLIISAILIVLFSFTTIKPESYPKQTLKSLEISLFVDFCKEKGYNETAIFPNRKYCFVFCSLDGWAKSDCFSREEFEKWLK